MHVTLSSTQQIILVHEEGAPPQQFTTTVTATQDGAPFEMVLVDGPTFLELGDHKIDFQEAKGALTATVDSQGEAWYLILRANQPTDVEVETVVAPAPVPPAKVKTSLEKLAPAPPAPAFTPASGPVISAAPAAAAPAPINWMFIAAIALIVLLIGYFLYTQFLAPKPSAASKLRSL